LKVVLISPPVTRHREFDHTKARVSPFFPLGLAYLAAAIIKAGYDVVIRDYLINFFDGAGSPYHDTMVRYGASDEHIVGDLRNTHADVVGISCLFSAQEFDARLLCRLARTALPGAFVVMGGPHAGASSVEFMESEPELDGVVLGEAEESITELIGALIQGRDLQSVDGLAWRAEDRKVFRQEKTRYIENLDALSMPARFLFDMDLYFEKAKGHNVPEAEPCAQMITSRGCPFRCSFCALGNHWGKCQRKRSAANVLEEIRFLVETYGIREIHFEDDNLTSDKQRALEIFRGMRDANWDLRWAAPTGLAIATLDGELLAAMKESGCYSISVAIESGDQTVLTKLMRKPVRLERVPRVVQTARKCGLLVKGFFILGYPGETKETMRKTVDFARSLELDWAFFFVATPIPHTEMWDTCVKEGYFDPSDYDPTIGFLRCQIQTPEFTPQEVAELREEAIIECNFRNNVNLRRYDVERAIRDFKGVLEIYPHFDFAHVSLGEAYLRKGLVEEARACWLEALRYNPNNADALRLLNAAPSDSSS